MPLLEGYGFLPPLTADPNTAGAFDKEPPKEASLSQDIRRLAALDNMFAGLGTMGQQAMQIGSPWTGIPGGGRNPGILQGALLQDQQQQAEQQQAARTKLFGQTGGGLLGQAYPELYGQALMSQMFPEAPDLPTGMRQNPDGTWSYDPEYLKGQEALRKAGRDQTTFNVGPQGIDYGDPPKDMAWARNEDGSIALEPDPKTLKMRPIAVPIGGSELEAERLAAEEAAEGAAAEQKKYADIVIDDIDRVIGMVEGADWPITGIFSGSQAIPGTPAHNAAKLIETIRANVGFDRLQAMRDASPTGGALGQVSENENALMQATLGNLALSQDEDQFLYNMRRVKETYLDIIHGPGNRPAAPKPKTYTPDELQGMTDEDLEKLLRGD